MPNVTIDIPVKLISRADALLPALSASSWAALVEGEVEREHVLRVALSRGLDAFEAELGAPPVSVDADVRKQLQFDYWIELGKLLTRMDTSLKAPEITRPYTWYNWSIGSPHHVLCANLGARDGRITVWLNVQGADADSYYQELLASRARIEADLGYPLAWEDREGRKEKKLAVRRSGDYARRATWPELHSWTAERLREFERVFGSMFR